MTLIGSKFKQSKRAAFTALAVTVALGAAVPSAALATGGEYPSPGPNSTSLIAP